MVTRRQVLVGGTLSGAAVLIRNVSEVFAAVYKDKPTTPVQFQVPPRACDSHFHIYDSRFPYVPGPEGKPIAPPPEPATMEEARPFLRTLHIERIVIVQSQAYATDNRCTLDAIKQFGQAARGVALIDPDKTTDKMLDELYRGGIRGIRIHPLNVVKQFAGTVKLLAGRRNWHVQLQTSLDVIEKLQDQIAAAPLPISIDHFAGMRPAEGPDQRGFRTLLNLVRAGKVYLKLSGVPQRLEFGAAITPLAKELVAANPERLLWGSDWPFMGAGPDSPVDMGRIFNQLTVWAPTPAQRQLILVDNPARLYDF